MPLELKKIKPISISSAGFDERWLQARIREDPGLLGLGELTVLYAEYRQPTGGRIDFLMRDEESDIYYEVEVMLGALNESHIIRAIEYWDIERRRKPSFEHRAVIVAEQITRRFFNILRLFDRAVQIVAIQLNAFQFENTIVLHPARVLDVIEDEDEPVESVDRAYWVKQPDGSTLLAVVDRVRSLLGRIDDSELGVSYARNYVGLATSGFQFCRFIPRKNYVRVSLRTSPATIDTMTSSLGKAGLQTSKRANRIRINLTLDSITEHEPLVRSVLEQAEAASRE